MTGYQQTWLRPGGLKAVSGRIHDGVRGEENLKRRAADRRDTFFRLLFPYAAPTSGSKVLELGQGVGWIMEAMLDAYPIAEIVGLDISPNMLKCAAERWSEPRALYVLYDGLRVPLADNTFDNIYSVACIQHIEKHHAFLVMKELFRMLKPGGHGTLHLMSVGRIGDARSFEEECWIHLNDVETHWHHYYSYDELFVLFAEALQVTDLDIKFYRKNFWVHFSKGSSERFHSDDVERAYFPNRDLPQTLRPRV